MKRAWQRKFQHKIKMHRLARAHWKARSHKLSRAYNKKWWRRALTMLKISWELYRQLSNKTFLETLRSRKLIHLGPTRWWLRSSQTLSRAILTHIKGKLVCRLLPLWTYKRSNRWNWVWSIIRRSIKIFSIRGRLRIWKSEKPWSKSSMSSIKNCRTWTNQ